MSWDLSSGEMIASDDMINKTTNMQLPNQTFSLCVQSTLDTTLML